MTSLPQGWHGVGQNKATKSAETCVPTVRQRWNTCPATEPSIPHRKTSLGSLPNGFQSRITPPRTSARSALTLASKGQPSLFPPPGAQSEIALLKKDLSSTKNENAALKAAVRKLQDDCSQKNRQIMKLRSEILTENNNHRKTRETETITSLRQKVSGLENVLKDKDKIVKKMFHEICSANSATFPSVVKKYGVQFGISTNGLFSNIMKNQQSVLLKNGPAVPKPQKIVRDASKVQVEKLKNMVHKLESELQVMQKQMKSKDRDVHLLKLQMSRQTPTARTVSQSSASNPPSRTASSSLMSNVSRNSTTRIPSATGFAKRSPISTLQCNGQKTPSVSSRATMSNTSVSPLYRNQAAVPKQKLHLMNTQTFKCSQRHLERQAQQLRENNAAKKIQKGWRRHREAVESESSLSIEQRSWAHLIAEVKAHHERESQSSSYAGDSEEEHLTNEQVRDALMSIFKCDAD